MANVGSRTPEHHGSQGNAPDAREIERLVSSLGDQDYLAHPEIRGALISRGKEAVGPLIAAVSSPNGHLRWEAAKILGMMRNPQAAPALVQAMDDDRFGVRWLAAEGLISLGRNGLIPLLNALIQRSDSAWLREGAHHVLRTLAGRGLYAQLAPVLAALEDIQPAVQVPPAARASLDALSQAPAPSIRQGSWPRK